MPALSIAKKRFKSYSNIEYFVNDGRSLSSVEDNSIDFIFSFDSLVHAEADVMKSYIQEFYRILASDGMAFIHHSNLGYYHKNLKFKISNKIGKFLKKSGLRKDTLFRPHWRGTSVSHKNIKEFCNQFGLKCVNQEVFAWPPNYSSFYTDCISIISNKPTSSKKENLLFANNNFIKEALNARSIYENYYDLNI